MSTHTGTVIADLIATVNRRYKGPGNDLLCVCGAKLGEHSHQKLECPNPADSGDLFLESRYIPSLDNGVPCVNSVRNRARGYE